MQIRNTLAIVDDQFIYTAHKKDAHEFVTLQELLLMAEKRNFTHLWIVAETDLSRTASVFDGTPTGWKCIGMEKKSEKRWQYAAYRRENDRYEKSIKIGFPEWAGWPWEGDQKSSVLFATIAYIEDELGIPVEWSLAHMSLDYLRKKNEKRWWWLTPVTTELERHGFKYDEVTGELRWPPRGSREQEYTDGERIDGNSAYAAGISGLRVGEGNPEWASDLLEIEHIYDGMKPGFWHLSRCAKMDSLFDGVQLPSFEALTWATTDLVEQLRRTGYSIGIDQGWYWKKYHQTLRSTVSNEQGDGLWDLRVKWRDAKGAAKENAAETFRLTLKALHGRLGYEENHDRFKRRDIWAMVVGRSVAMMIYRIVKIYRDCQVLPVRIKIDELTYHVPSGTFDQFLDQNKLGGFKKVEK